jgi:hypothetical protein
VADLPGGSGRESSNAAARERVQARLAAAGARPVAQIGYWKVSGGITYQDPDGREMGFASWTYVRPRSRSVPEQPERAARTA